MNKNKSGASAGAAAASVARAVVDSKNPAEQFQSGLSYLYGAGVKKDIPAALELINKAAKQGDAKAQCFLADLYRTGEAGVTQDAQMSMKWYHKAADRGFDEAQFRLGIYYEKLGNTLINYRAWSVFYYKQAAAQKHPGALFKLLELSQQNDPQARNALKKLKERRGGLPDWIRSLTVTLPQQAVAAAAVAPPADAAQAVAIAAGSGASAGAGQSDALGQHRVGDLCIKGSLSVLKDVEKGMMLSHQAADQGTAAMSQDDIVKSYANTLNNLANCYERGEGGIPQNTVYADFYRKQAIELGYEPAAPIAAARAAMKDPADVEAQLKYDSGARLFKGIGVEADLQKAAAFFKSAAHKRHVQAQYDIGVCYLLGIGVTKNAETAVEWFSKAAAQKHALAQYQLSVCLLTGEGVAKDANTAMELLKKAADNGCAVAQNNWGFCLERGEGVAKDEAAALEYYRKAANQNLAEAKYNIGISYATGMGTHRNIKKAKEWLTKAKGSQVAQKALDNLSANKSIGGGRKERNQEANLSTNLISVSIKAEILPIVHAEVGATGVQKSIQVKTIQIQTEEKLADPISHQTLTSSERERYFRLGVSSARENKTEQAFYYYRRAENYPEAQYNLGQCYEQGQVTPQDEDAAITWYGRSAAQGNDIAQNSLGLCYEDGIGVKKHEGIAVAWYRKAAEKGNMDAQYNLGCCCEEGIGMKPNKLEAAKWYCKAADQGHLEAKNALGRLSEKGGEGVTAVSLYREAANQGLANAQYNLGRCCENGIGMDPDKHEAARWYQKAADQGHVAAKDTLGTFFENGIGGVKKDIGKAINLYRQAAEEEEENAQYNLGRCCEYGIGMNKDVSAAVDWYRKAAENGQVAAKNVLGMLLEFGEEGVEKDINTAVDLYRQAANQGLAMAQYNLGRCCECGIGMNIDMCAAVDWYRKAAKQEITVAYFALGLCYEESKGVKKDERAAIEWYQKAAAKGYLEAQQKVAALSVKQTTEQKEIPSAILNAATSSIPPAGAASVARAVVESENPVDQFQSGLSYFYGAGVKKDIPAALEFINKAAKQGDAKAQCFLADLYRTGEAGVTQDAQASMKWYHKAADRGFDEAQFRLGIYYEKLGNTLINYRAWSVFYYRQAAAQKHPGALFKLMELSQQSDPQAKKALEELKKLGAGLPKWMSSLTVNLPEQAVAVAALAPPVDKAAQVVAAFASGARAEQSEVLAQHRLANCYMKGIDVQKDVEKGVMCSHQAADQGMAVMGQGNDIAESYANTLNSLADCYEKGEGGIPQNAGYADFYRKQAAVLGYKPTAPIAGASAAMKGATAGEVTGVEKRTQAEKKLADTKTKAVAASHQPLASSERERYFQLGLSSDQKKEKEKAFHYFRIAATEGDQMAQVTLGFRYNKGDGTPKDEDAAITWYGRSAAQGCYEAQHVLGVCYQDGIGVKRHAEIAVAWYRKSAEARYSLAEFKLGWCYENGIGIEKDERAAAGWYRRSAEQGNKDAQFNLGSFCEVGKGVKKDERAAAGWYRQSAEQGRMDAQFNLGLFCEFGIGVDKDEGEAFKFYSKAAEQGDLEAQCKLGFFCEQGKGVKKDKREAVNWYRKAAGKGHVGAKHNLGRLLELGTGGVQKDVSAAVGLYKEAAEQGDMYAQENLGRCFEHGIGVAKDDNAAIGWYQKAAAQGSAIAQPRVAALRAAHPVLERSEAKQVQQLQPVAQPPAAAEAAGVAVAQASTEAPEKATAAIAVEAGKGLLSNSVALMLSSLAQTSSNKPLPPMPILSVQSSDAASTCPPQPPVQSPTQQQAQANFGDVGLLKLVRLVPGDLPAMPARALLFADEELKLHAVAKGDLKAQQKVAVLSVKQTTEQKETPLNAATSSDSRQAEYELGVRYATGRDVEKNALIATWYFAKAARERREEWHGNVKEIVICQGLPQAQFQLALHYIDGSGVEKDRVQAAYWFSRAAEQKYEGAQGELDKLVAQMTTDERDLLVARRIIPSQAPPSLLWRKPPAAVGESDKSAAPAVTKRI